MKGSFRKFRIRLFNYEYWTWWLFFLPLFPVYLWYVVRLKNPVYFTAANPGIEFGGLFGEQKNQILEQIPDAYKAKTIYCKSVNIELLLNEIRQSGFNFPLVIKPNVGERGDEVCIAFNEEDLIHHLTQIAYPFLIQEYIDYPTELGVFYTRLPDSETGKIVSIVLKNFLSVEGDGESSVSRLLEKQDRGFLQLERLNREKPELMKMVPTQNELVIVERVGNHCLGTEFINANYLINESLNQVFDEISKSFEGFFYGRYDLKIRSVEEMYQGKGIRIFELNGVTSEPGHIYDSEMSLLQSYRDLIKQQQLLAEICRQNLRQIKTPSTGEVLKRLKAHFFAGKR
ncbi:MAG: hypothetical protein GC181_03780 [Bacteroidetes bacterium]|nr:hypothetical protein [Bacteroidota bacterium]